MPERLDRLSKAVERSPAGEAARDRFAALLAVAQPARRVLKKAGMSWARPIPAMRAGGRLADPAA